MTRGAHIFPGRVEARPRTSLSLNSPVRWIPALDTFFHSPGEFVPCAGSLTNAEVSFGSSFLATVTIREVFEFNNFHS